MRLTTAAGVDTAEDILSEGADPIPEASDFSGLGRSTLYKLMDKGLLPYVKIGRSRRIPRRALVRLLASGLRGGWATNPEGKP